MTTLCQGSWAHTTKKQSEKLLELIRRLAEDEKEGVMAHKVRVTEGDREGVVAYKVTCP